MKTSRRRRAASLSGVSVAFALAACASGPSTTPGAADGLASAPVAATSPSAQTSAPRAAPAGDKADPELSAKDSKNVARTLTRVSELRGITPSRAVPGVKLAREELVARVKEKALREYPADALRREGQLLQILGFAPSSFDYLGEMMRLLEAQLEGFYEPKNGTMYLAADLKGKEAQATLAHELVHALQDQRWDLKSRSTYRPGKGDETMALAALAEGDATSVMMDYILREQNRTALDLPEEMLRELMKSAAVSMNDVQSVPHVLRTTLIAPYVDGLAFVHALRRRGGWAMVDRAWDRPPSSTEQILHVDKWQTDEKPLTVPTPSGLALGQGYKLVDEDTFGELGLALSFEEWTGADEARAAAAGWGGDRSGVYARGDDIALAVHVRFDAGAPRPDAFAERAMTKIAGGIKRTFAGAKPRTDTATAICLERKDTGPLMVARKDRDLAIVVGPARTAGGAWSSASTCSSAKAWADEILAQK